MKRKSYMYFEMHDFSLKRGIGEHYCPQFFLLYFQHSLFVLAAISLCTQTSQLVVYNFIKKEILPVLNSNRSQKRHQRIFFFNLRGNTFHYCLIFNVCFLIRVEAFMNKHTANEKKIIRKEVGTSLSRSQFSLFPIPELFSCK